MNDLKEKYGGFSSPAFSVKINGSNIPQKFCKGAIDVELSADYEASSCSISIYNAFLVSKNDEMDIDSDIKKFLKLGSKIEVILGYKESEGESVFIGYIDTISIDYDKDFGSVYIIECLDGKGIMMNSLSSETKVSIKKYSEAVEKTVKKYSSIIDVSSKNIDKSDNTVTTLIEQHNESDYGFVVRIARRLGYCFYIDKGELIFKPFSKLSKETFFEFNVNYYIMSFKMDISLRNQVSSVTVRSNNEKDPNKVFEAKVSSIKSIADNSSVKMNNVSIISKDVSRNIIDYTVNSEEEAKKVAEARYQELSLSRYQGKIKTIGVPVITAGKFVDIKGFSDDFDGKYFVKKVIHHIKDGKYTTECELEGNSI